MEKPAVVERKSRACLKCGCKLQAKGAGRPATYCSVACRRAAEFEIRRVQDRLVRLEDELEQLRRDRSGLPHMIHGTPEERLAGLEAEIERQEARLRALLDEGPSASP